MTIAPQDGTPAPPPIEPKASPTPLYPNNRVRRHLSELFRLALPVTIARLGMLIMSVVDTIVVGNYDSAGLAYLNVAHAPFTTLMVTGIGLLTGVMILTSSPPSSGLSPAVSLECPTKCWQLRIGVALVAGLNPTSHDTS